MPGANPLLHVPADAGTPADSVYFQQGAGGAPAMSTPAAHMGSRPGPDVGDVGDVLNTNVHVGAAAIAALVVIFLLHLGGFRFAFDVGMGRR